MVPDTRHQIGYRVSSRVVSLAEKARSRVQTLFVNNHYGYDE